MIKKTETSMPPLVILFPLILMHVKTKEQFQLTGLCYNLWNFYQLSMDRVNDLPYNLALKRLTFLRDLILIVSVIFLVVWRLY